MKRPLLVIALAALPLIVRAEDTAPLPPQTAADAPADNTAPRNAYEVPQQRITPPDEKRPRQERGNEWQRRQAALEKDVRAAMSANGFTDAAVQDAILAHIKSEATARAPLRERGRRLFRGLNSPKVNDAEMSLALGGYITALAADRTRRSLAEEALDNKIGWSKNPRLHSMLLLFGIIGESPITLPIRNFSQPPRALPRPDIKPDNDVLQTPAPVPTAPQAPTAAPQVPANDPAPTDDGPEDDD